MTARRTSVAATTSARRRPPLRAAWPGARAATLAALNFSGVADDPSPPEAGLARRVLWLLIVVNFLNYLDRFIFVAVGPQFKRDFHLDNQQVGMAASAFLLVYTLAALPAGLWADHGSRTRIIAFGLAAWSLATWYTAIAHTFAELFLGRAVLGIGEACYVPAGLALLGAYFAPGARARVMSQWGVGSLVGTACGYILGGVIAQHFGWRWAFVLCGPPGLLLAWLVWRLPDRRVYDAADAAADIPAPQPAPGMAAQIAAQIRLALRSPVVRLVIGIQALALFITTPAVVFIPVYLSSRFALPVQTTALLVGGLLIPGGIIGTLGGGWLADRLSRRYRSGRMLAVAIGFAGAAPLLVLGLLAGNLIVLLSVSFLAVVFLNIFSGPLNAVVQDVVPASRRASAAAIIMTLAHLFGDVSSPTIVGHLADLFHQHSHRSGEALALIVCGAPVLTLAALLAFWGARLYVRALDRRAAEPGPTPDAPTAALAMPH